MEYSSNMWVVAGGVLIIWSCALVWGSWRVRVMLRELRDERAAVRRWVRLKAVWERQNGRWG
jgi:hypothetical protein